MKQLVILSGKVGTGKTSLTAALADLANQSMNVVLVDADVDAANLELVCKPEKMEEHVFMGGRIAIIDQQSCISCGVCEEVCRFDAVYRSDSGYSIVPLQCEGCDACVHQCPEQAIRSEEQHAGFWYRSDSLFGVLFHAHLFAGAENSGKLVGTVRQSGRKWAEEQNIPLILIDGPPGIGCPVIAACSGTDMALFVSEPSVSAIHDLERAVDTANHFGIPAAVVVNKSDLNPTRTAEIISYCRDSGIHFIGKLPFDPEVTKAMTQGLPVTSFDIKTEAAIASGEIWSKIRKLLEI